MLKKIQYLTAGESHGKGLIGIINWIPANIEIDENYQSNNIEKTNTKKKNKTTKVIKKKKVIKTKKTKKNIKKNNLDNNEIKEGSIIDTDNDLNITESDTNEDEEKTGWWS